MYFRICQSKDIHARRHRIQKEVLARTTRDVQSTMAKFRETCPAFTSGSRGGSARDGCDSDRARMSMAC